MKRYQLLCLALVSVLCSLFTNEARASHAAGAELYYQWISDSTYKFYWKFYRDCDGTTEPTSISMCYSNPCTNLSGSVLMNKVSGTVPGGGINGQSVSTGCPNGPTTCTFGSLPGYQEWWYECQFTVPSRCNSWVFYVSLNARNASITNLTGPGGQSIYVETTLNNVAAQGNSSAYFTNQPVGYLCVNSPYTFNNGGVDPNGDSLAYDIIQPRTQGGSCTSPPNATDIPYSSTIYNITNNPISTANTFTINAVTGAMAFTPDITQIGVLTVRVREYRNGIQIGSVLRDIQLVVLPCNAQQPINSLVTSSLVGASFVGNTLQGCATQPMAFCFDMVSPNPQAILVASSNQPVIIPAATLTFTGQTTDSIRGCFSWTPGVNDTGLKVITVSVKDSTCVPPGIAVQQTFTFPIYINPLTIIKNDTAICPGDTVQLEAFGGSTFSWSVLPGGSPLSSLSCTNCKTPKAYPTTTTRYVVTSNLTSICNKNVDTVTITVVPPPTINLGPDRTTCVNDTIQLNGNLVTTPGTTYGIKWNPAAGLSNDTIIAPLASPAITTQYILTVVPNGLSRCAARDTINVNVLRGFDIFNTDTAICLGSTVNIAASGDPLYTYTWSPVAGVSNPTLLTPSITPTVVGNYTYTITARYPGCSDSSQRLRIDVQPVPTVTVDPDEILCYGDTVHLNGVVSPFYANYIYSWTPGGSVSNPGIEDPVFTALATTTLTLNVSTPAGCEDEDEVTFTVVEAKFIEVSSDTAICPRDTAQLRVTSSNGVPVSSVRWTPNRYISNDTSFTPSVYPVVTTRYFVSGRDTNFCLDTGSVLVTVKPEAVIYIPDSVRIYPGESYQMDPKGNCLYFQWFPPYGLTSDTIANPIARPEVNTRYFVSGRTEFGCTAQDSIDVFVNVDSYVDVANAFTPGSSPNGTIKVSHKGIVNLKYFRIYNRWGAKVFETSDVNTGWDGTLNGAPQPMGVYVYVVEGTTPTGRPFFKQGNITLIR